MRPSSVGAEPAQLLLLDQPHSPPGPRAALSELGLKRREAQVELVRGPQQARHLGGVLHKHVLTVEDRCAVEPGVCHGGEPPELEKGHRSRARVGVEATAKPPLLSIEVALLGEVPFAAVAEHRRHRGGLCRNPARIRGEELLGTLQGNPSRRRQLPLVTQDGSPVAADPSYLDHRHPPSSLNHGGQPGRPSLRPSGLRGSRSKGSKSVGRLTATAPGRLEDQGLASLGDGREMRDPGLEPAFTLTLQPAQEIGEETVAGAALSHRRKSVGVKELRRVSLQPGHIGDEAWPKTRQGVARGPERQVVVQQLPRTRQELRSGQCLQMVELDELDVQRQRTFPRRQRTSAVLAADLVVAAVVKIAHDATVEVDRLDADGRLGVSRPVVGPAGVRQVKGVGFSDDQPPVPHLFEDVVPQGVPHVELLDRHPVEPLEIPWRWLEERPLIALEIDRGGEGEQRQPARGPRHARTRSTGRHSNSTSAKARSSRCSGWGV